MRSRPGPRLLYPCWIVIWVTISPCSWGAPSWLDLVVRRREYSILSSSSSRSLESSSSWKENEPHSQHYPDHHSSNHLLLLGSCKVLSIPRGGADTLQSSSWRTVSRATMNEFWKAHPLLAGGSVCAIKATLADLLAQKIQHASSTSSSPQKYDFRRTFAFMMYGALYQGM
eukprot:scaffold5744_cov159-Amphora_coffeaeformis.AAC.3